MKELCSVPEFYDLYVFDLDGTLIDSLSDLADSVNLMLLHFRLPEVGLQDVKKAIGSGARNLISQCLSLSLQSLHERERVMQNASIDIDECLSYYRETYRARCLCKTKPYPKMLKTLRDLESAGKIMTVLTNKPTEAARSILDGLALSGCFQIIAGPEYAGVLKPDPSGIGKILNECGISGDRAIMVGDSAVDILTGKAAMISTCGIIGGLGDHEDMISSVPDYVVDLDT